EELLQTFKKVETNIPLLDAIKQILKYAKFLKKLCIHKRNKLKEDVDMGRNGFALIKSEQVSVLIQPAMPKKCIDPGTYIVPCTTGECTFVDAMLDLDNLKFGDLEPTSVIIQVENKSIAHPLDMEGKTTSKGSTLILGRPFLMTISTKIDMHV
ncbi:hypothetical protein CR513_59251, partial [Mucuna pruriens]